MEREMKSAGIVTGVIGVLFAAGVGAYGYLNVTRLDAEVAALKNEVNSRFDAEIKLPRDAVKSHAERIENLEKSIATLGDRLTADASGMDSRLEALERPNVVRKEVETSPSKYLKVTGVKTFDPGIVNEYTALSTFSLQNDSDADIVWIELKVTYKSKDGDLGSKLFSIGDKNTRNPDRAILPKGATVVGNSLQSSGNEGRGAFMFSSHETMISGHAQSCTVEVTRVRALQS
jgi:hypothetical protein